MRPAAAAPAAAAAGEAGEAGEAVEEGTPPATAAATAGAAAATADEAAVRGESAPLESAPPEDAGQEVEQAAAAGAAAAVTPELPEATSPPPLAAAAAADDISDDSSGAKRAALEELVEELLGSAEGGSLVTSPANHQPAPPRDPIPRSSVSPISPAPPGGRVDRDLGGCRGWAWRAHALFILAHWLGLHRRVRGDGGGGMNRCWSQRPCRPAVTACSSTSRCRPPWTSR
jgi:hypothetical protein